MVLHGALVGRRLSMAHGLGLLRRQEGQVTAYRTPWHPTRDRWDAAWVLLGVGGLEKEVFYGQVNAATVSAEWESGAGDGCAGGAGADGAGSRSVEVGS